MVRLMASLNRAQIIGYVGADPDVREVSGSKTVASLRIATNERWTDESGEKHERTDWHRIVVWNQHARFCRDYVRKGHALYVEGPMHVRTWEDKEGVKRYTTEIVARNLQLLDRKGEPPAPTQDKAEDDPVGDIWPELKK